MTITHLKAYPTTKIWLDWNWVLDNPHDSKDDWKADNECDIELDISIENSETPQQQDVSAIPNVSELIWPTQRSKTMAEKVLMMVSTMETRSNKAIKNK